MDRNGEEVTDGASCAVDRSCCGGAAGAGVDKVAASSCTLDPSAMPERVARWRALFSQVRDHGTRLGAATFHFPKTAEITSELEELVKLERVCCAHVAWGVVDRDGGLLLTLEADADALKPLVAGFMPEMSRARQEGTS